MSNHNRHAAWGGTLLPGMAGGALLGTLIASMAGWPVLGWAQGMAPLVTSSAGVTAREEARNAALVVGGRAPGSLSYNHFDSRQFDYGRLLRGERTTPGTVAPAGLEEAVEPFSGVGRSLRVDAPETTASSPAGSGAGLGSLSLAEGGLDRGSLGPVLARLVGNEARKLSRGPQIGSAAVSSGHRDLGNALFITGIVFIGLGVGIAAYGNSKSCQNKFANSSTPNA